MIPADIAAGISLLIAVASLAATAVAWVSQQMQARHKAAKSQVDQLRTDAFGAIDALRTELATEERAAKRDASEQDRRLSIVEERLRHVPDTQTIIKLIKTNEELRGDHKGLMSTVEAMGKQISTIAGTVTRIDDYLRDNKK